MTNEPILILGFGRSGTTWISDIVSKMLGGIILFEPFHPEVFEKAKECCYHNASNNNLLDPTAQHIENIFDKKISNKWLLRNHLSTKLEAVSDRFVNDVWDNCNVIGYKSIRQNFMIPWLHENISSKIVFLKRDILSVIASLVRRERFWEEFGFDFHEKKFLEETLNSNKYDFLDSVKLLDTYKSLDDSYLKMTFIWTVTHLIVEKELKELTLPIFHYKDFYLTPYEASMKLANYLGYENMNLHPSYIFTPSMLTLKTFHKEVDADYLDKNLTVFWKNTLTDDMVSNIINLEKEIESATIQKI